MAVVRRDVVQLGHDHRLHRAEREAQRHRARAHQPRRVHQRINGEDSGGAEHRPAQHLRLIGAVREQRHDQAHARHGQRKHAENQADRRRREAALVAEDGQRKGVHVPRRRQQPVDEQQAAHARRVQQIPGGALRVVL